MGTNAETPVAWTMPFTVFDQAVIAALDVETRAVVERYRRSAPAPPPEERKKDILSELRGIYDEISILRSRVEDIKREVCA